jgi:hypothetical protein
MSDRRAIALRKDLRAAAELRRMSIARQFDDAYAEAGGTTVYAIDTAILNSMLSPGVPGDEPADAPEGQKGAKSHSVSVRAAARPVAGEYQIFYGPDGNARKAELRARQARLAPVLRWYLLDRHSRNGAPRPYLLLPGHDFEARGLFDRIVAAISRQDQKLASVNQCAEELKRIVKSAREQDCPAEEVSPDVTRLLYALLFDIHEPHEKFEKFNQLLQDRRLMRTGSAIVDPRFTVPELRRHGRHVFALADFRRGRGARPRGSPGSMSWWSNELHGQLPESYLERDRIALSVLDDMNRAIDPSRARIVLFTDNSKFMGPGGRYFPWAEDRSDFYAQMSFSDLYLRHVKSALLDPEFLRPTAPDAPLAEDWSHDDIDGWLETLLADVEEQEPARGAAGVEATLEALASRLREFAGAASNGIAPIDQIERLQQVLRRKPKLHKDLVARWTDYVEKLIEGHSTIGAPAAEVIRETFGSHELASETGIDAFLEKIREVVRNLSEQSWNTFFRTAADTGLELIEISTGAQQEIVWPVPSLYFQTTGHLQKIIKSLWSPEQLRDQPNALVSMTDALRDQLDPRSAYVHTLCYGLMFAFAGRWPLSRLLAQRAIQVSKTEGLSREGGGAPWSTGREAYYLLAVATRVLSHSEKDLDDARLALDLARNARADPAEGAERSGAPLTGVRFRAEAFAIDVARLSYLEQKKPAEALRERGRIRRGILEELSSSKKCEEPHIAVKTRVALRSEYFATFLPGRKETHDEPLLLTIAHSERPTLHRVVMDQIADIEALYEDKNYVPSRDRRLLQFIVLQLGRQARTPPWVAYRVEPGNDEGIIPAGTDYWSKQALAVVDGAIDKLMGALAPVPQPSIGR